MGLRVASRPFRFAFAGALLAMASVARAQTEFTLNASNLWMPVGGAGLLIAIVLTGLWLASLNTASRLRRKIASLTDSETFARSTVNALSAQIAIVDIAGVIVSVNDSWRDGLQQNGAIVVADAIGKNYLAFCDQLTGEGCTGASAVADGIRAVATGQRGDAFAEYRRGEDANARWFLCRTTRFPGNNKVRIVVAHEEITDRKKAEEAAEAARRTADAANQAKSAFLANMSHEIRTPMTAMLGYADLLLETTLPQAERERCVQVIRRNGDHLLSLINDVLDISKIEANKYDVDCVRCDLRHLLADVVALTRVKAIQKGLNFRVVVDGPVPKEIKTDPLRLKQILVNLIGNAVKFTTTGGVFVRVSCHDKLVSSTLHVDIVDTGIGMTEHQQERLFRPFTQADESTTRKFGGTGLGLVISRRLAQLLGGDIRVRSKLKEGSCFSVWVDSGQLGGVRLLPALDEADLVSATPLSTRTTHNFVGDVLLAEDGEDNQQLISLLLRNAGAEVTLAVNGKAAVEIASQRKFDLILMDMQMPELDGYGAARQLRNAKVATPIVALTANAMADDRSKCMAAGCDDYLAKPVRMDQFHSILAKYLRSSELAAAAAAEETPEAPANLEKLQSGLASNPKLKSVLDRFIARLPERIEEMSRLLRAQDLSQLARTVHQIKGAAGGYGFPEITASATKAEQSIKRADDFTAITQQIDELNALIRRVEGYPQDLAIESTTPAETPGTPAASAVVSGPRLRVDKQSGLPNRFHLLQRISSQLAIARRKGLPLSCIAIQVLTNEPAVEDSAAEISPFLRKLIQVLETEVNGDRELFRAAPHIFVLVVPETDSEGTAALINRLETALDPLRNDESVEPGKPICLFGSAQLQLTTTSAAELLASATGAISQPTTI